MMAAKEQEVTPAEVVVTHVVNEQKELEQCQQEDVARLAAVQQQRAAQATETAKNAEIEKWAEEEIKTKKAGYTTGDEVEKEQSEEKSLAKEKAKVELPKKR